MTEHSAGGTDYPKRRRWDENYDALPYETDEFDGGQVEGGTERVEYLLELSQDRLANGCEDEIYNRALRDASAWWLTSTDKERAEKREKVFERERLLTNLFLKSPQIGWYNDYLHKKLEKYEGWTEVFKSVEAAQSYCPLRMDTSREER